MARTRLAAALLLCVAGGALSLVLLSKHYGVPLLGEAVLAACGEGGGCDVVSQSRYAMFLGAPLAAWGLFFYGSLLALLAPTLLGKPDEAPETAPAVGFFLVALAVGIDVVLLGLQAFAIQAFCKFCVATYAVNLLLLGSLWPFRQVSRVMTFLLAPESRRALVAWSVTTLAVAAAVASGDSALEARKTLAGTSILGVPSLIQAPPKIEKGSVEEQLAQAQAEARKWKDTLDDEKKLQEYLTEKAKSDFNKAEVTKLDLSRSPFSGVKDSPITVVSFSDFMCPFCRNLALGLKGYLPTSGNRVKVHFKHFPLDTTCNPRIANSLHPGSCQLSLGGICADESGRFWEFHDKVFAQTWERATREDVLRIGASVGLEGAKFSSCLDDAATKGRLAKDIDEGWRVGVASTPTVFVNGRKLDSTGVFLLAVEEERKRLNLPPLSGPATPKNP